MSTSQCAACGAIVPHYDTVNTVSEGHGDRLLCTACFNREMAHHVGLDEFGEVKFKPVYLSDANGTVHEFHFQTREPRSVGEAPNERRLHVDAENVSRNVTVKGGGKRSTLIKSGVTTTFPGASPVMDYRVCYEYSLASVPDDYIAKVPSQVVEDVPANIPCALLPAYITDLILKRSARIGKIRPLYIL
jgi:hypothetical protein